MRRTLITALAMAALVPMSVGAQSPTAEFAHRLSAAARDSLDRLIDSARVEGLPVMPLTNKVAEGLLKRVDESRILLAVRGLRRHLATASMLVPRGTTGTLGAAANALLAGASPRAIARLAAASPGNDAALAVGFVTLTDLVASNVPPEAAASSIEQLLQRGAPEAQMAALRSAVARDIQAGRSPEDALTTRTRAVVQSLGRP